MVIKNSIVNVSLPWRGEYIKKLWEGLIEAALSWGTDSFRVVFYDESGVDKLKKFKLNETPLQKKKAASGGKIITEGAIEGSFDKNTAKIFLGMLPQTYGISEVMLYNSKNGLKIKVNHDGDIDILDMSRCRLDETKRILKKTGWNARLVNVEKKPNSFYLKDLDFAQTFTLSNFKSILTEEAAWGKLLDYASKKKLRLFKIVNSSRKFSKRFLRGCFKSGKNEFGESFIWGNLGKNTLKELKKIGAPNLFGEEVYIYGKEDPLCICRTRDNAIEIRNWFEERRDKALLKIVGEIRNNANIAGVVSYLKGKIKKPCLSQL